MQYRPDATDLLGAVGDLLMKEILPRVKDDDLLAYKVLVSWNMLGVISRELDKGEELLDEELASFKDLLGDLPVAATYKEKKKAAAEMNTRLAEKIRADKGCLEDRQLIDHIKKSLAVNLKVANPRFQIEAGD